MCPCRTHHHVLCSPERDSREKGRCARWLTVALRWVRNKKTVQSANRNKSAGSQLTEFARVASSTRIIMENCHRRHHQSQETGELKQNTRPNSLHVGTGQNQRPTVRGKVEMPDVSMSAAALTHKSTSIVSRQGIKLVDCSSFGRSRSISLRKAWAKMLLSSLVVRLQAACRATMKITWFLRAK